MIRDEHTYADNSIRAEGDARDKLEAEIKRDYVADKTLTLILAPLRTTLASLEKDRDRVMWFIVIGFLSALARIVYVTTK